MKEIYLGAGSFYGVEKYFSLVRGVINTEVGYINNTEVVHLKYDPKGILLNDILNLYYEIIDPTKEKETEYKNAIYYKDQKDQDSILDSIKNLQEKYQEPLKIEVAIFQVFQKADESHQQYLKKNPFGYCNIPRDKLRNARNYKKIEKNLTFVSEYVTKCCGTEPPFINPYWNQFSKGIYVDIETGKPLFSSNEKYQSGYGWPSFYNTIAEEEIYTNMDYSYGIVREEIRSRSSNNHLGYRFPDGPKEKGGVRYSINSAALKFIPLEELQGTIYEKYLTLFK